MPNKLDLTIGYHSYWLTLTKLSDDGHHQWTCDCGRTKFFSAQEVLSEVVKTCKNEKCLYTQTLTTSTTADVSMVRPSTLVPVEGTAREDKTPSGRPVTRYWIRGAWRRLQDIARLLGVSSDAIHRAMLKYRNILLAMTFLQKPLSSSKTTVVLTETRKQHQADHGKWMQEIVDVVVPPSQGETEASRRVVRRRNQQESTQYWVEGEWRSLRNIADLKRISFSNLYQRITKGESLPDILTHPKKSWSVTPPPSAREAYLDQQTAGQLLTPPTQGETEGSVRQVKYKNGSTGPQFFYQGQWRSIPQLMTLTDSIRTQFMTSLSSGKSLEESLQLSQRNGLNPLPSKKAAKVVSTTPSPRTISISGQDKLVAHGKRLNEILKVVTPPSHGETLGSQRVVLRGSGQKTNQFWMDGEWRSLRDIAILCGVSFSNLYHKMKSGTPATEVIGALRAPSPVKASPTSALPLSSEPVEGTKRRMPGSSSKKQYWFQGEWRRVREIAALLGIDYEPFRQRLSRGVAWEEALPRKKIIPVPATRPQTRVPGSPTEGEMRSRQLSNGQKHLQYWCQGEWRSASACAKVLGLPSSRFEWRLRAGYSWEQSLYPGEYPHGGGIATPVRKAPIDSIRDEIVRHLTAILRLLGQPT